MTPVSEISITETKNSGRLEVFVIAVKTTLSAPLASYSLGELVGRWGTPPDPHQEVSWTSFPEVCYGTPPNYDMLYLLSRHG